MQKLTGDLEAAKAKAAALEIIHNQTTETRARGEGVDAQRHAQRALENGTATPQEIATAQDAATRNAAAHESNAGGAAQIDASQTAAHARTLESQLRNQRPQDRDPEHMADVHNALERMLGLMENSNVSPAQKVDMQDIIRRIEYLEAYAGLTGNIRR